MSSLPERTIFSKHRFVAWKILSKWVAVLRGALWTKRKKQKLTRLQVRNWIDFGCSWIESNQIGYIYLTCYLLFQIGRFYNYLFDKEFLTKMLFSFSAALFYGSIASFIAGVLLLMSFASPYWLASWKDTQSPFVNMGLWEFCFYKFRHPDYQFVSSKKMRLSFVLQMCFNAKLNGLFFPW